MVPQLEGTGLKVFIATAVFVAAATIAFGLRVWARLLIRAWGVDDWLMLAGCHHSHDPVDAHKSLNVAEYEDGMKWHFFIGLLYTVNTTIVKCSICCFMLRIARERVHRWIFKGVIHVSVIAAFIRIIVWVARCKNLGDNWRDNARAGKAGSCGSPALLTQVSIFFSVICITTDLVCAIVPAVIVYKLSLCLKQKICIGIMLGLGVIASIATMIRVKFLFQYQNRDDFLYNLAPIAYYSNFEIALGIAAACIATLRPLLRYLPCLSGEMAHCESEGRPYNSYKMRHMGKSRGDQAEQQGDMNRIDSQATMLSQQDSMVGIAK
ncbi:uncharacterized protein N0V89_002428 [Didymosphaeria variabile]|uniref:Rhodopsin domain-containing protein n=1 Tax=Didymosphaeria variabile TaxID=1932322 RepID=A0A9W8XRM1_9PLEO|nr:uncharacterized protein N0V89_002428 [Didymosphaeria variabile]KAJ4357852.1 hypothetical protein N0V89_002428 [Didymosphaeria variabile]